jgi:hypothetical protein
MKRSKQSANISKTKNRTRAGGKKRLSSGGILAMRRRMLKRNMIQMMRDNRISQCSQSSGAHEKYPGALQLKRVGVLEERQRNDELRLDYDSTATPQLRNVWRLLRLCQLRVCFIRHDRTRRGWHATIRIRENLSSAEIVACQAVLGSDAGRELLNIMRVMSIRKSGCDNFSLARWNLLFSRKLRRRLMCWARLQGSA